MARYDDRRDSVFLVLWTLAVLASATALLFYLGVRVRAMELGYELGKAQAELARKREVERVLSLEKATWQNPERVDLVARSLLGMQEVSSDRIRSIGEEPDSLQGENEGRGVASASRDDDELAPEARRP